MWWVGAPIYLLAAAGTSPDYTAQASVTTTRVSPGHGKSWNLGRPFSRPGKSWKMIIMSWNFYYCTEQFCKSDVTSFINFLKIMNRFIFLTMVLRADGTVTTNSGMHS